jgi:hypothetical protein
MQRSLLPLLELCSSLEQQIELSENVISISPQHKICMNYITAEFSINENLQ